MTKKKVSKTVIKEIRNEDIRVGDIYTIKKECIEECSDFEGFGKKAKSIRIKELTSSNWFYYEILGVGREVIYTEGAVHFYARHLAKRLYRLPVKRVKYIIGGTGYLTKADMLKNVSSGKEVYEVSKHYKVVSSLKLKEEV